MMAGTKMCTRSDNPVKENSGRPIPFRLTSDTSYVREQDLLAIHAYHHVCIGYVETAVNRRGNWIKAYGCFI